MYLYASIIAFMVPNNQELYQITQIHTLNLNNYIGTKTVDQDSAWMCFTSMYKEAGIVLGTNQCKCPLEVLHFWRVFAPQQLPPIKEF